MCQNGSSVWEALPSGRIGLCLFWCFFCLLGFSSERITQLVIHLRRNTAWQAIGISGHYHPSHASFGPRLLKKAHYGHVSFGTLSPCDGNIEQPTWKHS